ncbi:phosphotransferase family protein [Dactylosporangium sp. NPDC051485]|uniref:phosphotransferase family protein n=1 Tax=Dactylosporangium sp. NPDC051485 TaxID=3154846 RepID=UPI00342D7495
MVEALTQWAKQHATWLGNIQSARFPGEGGSSYNLLFKTDGPSGNNEFVAKLGALAPHLVTFPDEDLERQRRVMGLTRDRAHVPAPEVLCHEDDASWLGAPFFVMPRYEGRPWPSDPPYNYSGWVIDSSAEERQEMEDAFVDVLVKIHSIDVDGADLDFLATPERGSGSSALAGQVRYLEHYYAWSRGKWTFPLLERALTWLRGNIPSRQDSACVTWGDSRVGNLLFVGTSVTAVLDWECAGLGYPEVDLAFAEVMHAYYQDRAVSDGRAGLPRQFEGATMAQTYMDRGGRSIGDLHWYRVLAAARAAAIQVRFICRPVPGQQPVGDIGDSRITIRPLLTRLLDGSDTP